MVTAQKTYGLLPFYIAGSKKEFQKEGAWGNTNIAHTFSFDNVLPSFQLPFVQSTSIVSNITIYKLSDNFRKTDTYSEFVNYRDAGTALSISLDKITKGNITYFSFDGIQNIDTLTGGWYELSITFDTGEVFESDIIKICEGIAGEIALTNNWITKSGYNVITKGGDNAVYKSA